MDPAFQRRLSMAVAFPEPDDDLRERIWQVHIPKAVPRDPGLDLSEIARTHQFSGGHIRNAVMRALFFAASEGMPLRQAHLDEAIRLEYQNLGKLSQGRIVE
jgi:SpoVK/Ycf46/Vps4 family AAA+-type ATPase